MKLNQVFSSVINNKKKASVSDIGVSASTQAIPGSGSALTQSTTKHKSGKFFEDFEAKLKQEGPSFVSKVNAIIGFQVACPNNEKICYVFDLKNSPGSVFVNTGSKK